jgi:hypothetical protein
MKNSGDQDVIDISGPKYKIYVATPVHSECSIHYTQALLKFQQHCMLNGIMVSFSLLKIILSYTGEKFMCKSNFWKNDKNNYIHHIIYRFRY